MYINLSKINALQLFIRRESSLIISVLREAFVATLPFVLLSSFTLLVFQALNLLNLQTGKSSAELLQNFTDLFQSLYPAFIQISISFHLAKRYNVSSYSAVVLGFITSIAVALIYEADISASIIITSGASIRSVIVPILTTIAFKIFDDQFKRRIHLSRELLANPTNASVMTIVPFFFAFLATFILFTSIKPVVFAGESLLHGYLSSISPIIMGLFSNIIVHILWFCGLHGFNTLMLVTDVSFLNHTLENGLSIGRFYDIFIVFGGAGAALSLAIALLIASQDAHGKRIAKLSLPFTVFNINEIIIFGLPVILNRYLLIPFLLVPIVNITLAHFAITWGHITFYAHNTPWTTPIFLNAWIATEGNWSAIGIQVLCLLIDIAIYIPFVKRFTEIQSSSKQWQRLQQSLDISSAIDAQNGLRFHTDQAEIIQSHSDVEKVINLFHNNQLIVYYQPKIDIIKGECVHFEALLRVKKADGKIEGPYFLDTLERVGMATVIDEWVCKQVSHDLKKWALDHYLPKVAINLHPNTIQNTAVVEKIISMMKGLNVDFEVIERADVTSEISLKNLNLLSKAGFRIALDDFGSGYAGFVSLINMPLNVIKLDKTLIDATTNAKGFSIYEQSVSLTHALNMDCVAEGVETAEQLAFLKKLGVRYVQGFHFSPALAPEKVKYFTESFQF